jgi:hypothetical protein
VLIEAGIERGLVFVDTDHGFNLGFDPNVVDPNLGVVVARRKDPTLDALTFHELGRPNAWHYEFSWKRGAESQLGPFVPNADGVVALGALWPPLRVDGGWVALEHVSVEGRPGQALVLYPASSEPDSNSAMEVELETPRFEALAFEPRKVGSPGVELELRLLDAASCPREVVVSLWADDTLLARKQWRSSQPNAPDRAPHCSLPRRWALHAPGGPTPKRLALRVVGGPIVGHSLSPIRTPSGEDAPSRR